LNVSHVSVYHWIRKFGTHLETVRNDKPVEMMVLDELHTYIGRKNCQRVWTCVSRNDRQYVDFKVGNQGTKTGLKLWGRVGKLAVVPVMADHWKPYTEIVPAGQLLQTKVETYTVESFNALIRHYLARFRRRSNGSRATASKGYKLVPDRGRKPIMDCLDEEAVRRTIESDHQSVGAVKEAWQNASGKEASDLTI
jgi:insertion element IS1 protein InsB